MDKALWWNIFYEIPMHGSRRSYSISFWKTLDSVIAYWSLGIRAAENERNVYSITALIHYHLICQCRHARWVASHSDGALLPILGDIECPFELQIVVLIVILEFRDRFIVASSYHTRRCLIWIDWNHRSESNTLKGLQGHDHNSHFFSYTGFSCVLGAKEPCPTRSSAILSLPLQTMTK
jgi:hypothetical protein